MTKQYFEALAKGIRKELRGGHREADQDAAHRRLYAAAYAAALIASAAEEDNPRFDRARFLKACGLD